MLTSPPTCGPNTTTHDDDPVVGQPAGAPRAASFTLTTAPGGGACAKTLAERPFAPELRAPSRRAPRPAPSARLDVDIARADGQQELKGVDVDLPPGMTAKLAGVPYCPEAAIAAAAASAGAAEAGQLELPRRRAWSAPPRSPPAPVPRRSRSTARSSSQAPTTGLLSPWQSSPPPRPGRSTSARSWCGWRCSSTRKRRRSTPSPTRSPHVFGGAQLDIRSVVVNDRPQGIHPQPDQLRAAGHRRRRCSGGGADPANPAAFSSFPVSVPFQASDCDALGFRPKLFTRLFGGEATKRAAEPEAARGARRPRRRRQHRPRRGRPCRTPQFLDQSHIGTICTRVQLAAARMPGRARSTATRERQTPLLDDD